MLLNEHTTLPANLQEDQSLQDFLVFLWYLVLQEILEVPARKKRRVRKISMSDEWERGQRLLGKYACEDSVVQSSLERQLNASIVRVVCSSEVCMCQTIRRLTMGPGAPLGPAGPSFPWGPWKYKIRTETLKPYSSCLKNSDRMDAIKSSLAILTLTPAGPNGPTGPGGPREPCKHEKTPQKKVFYAHHL